MVWNNILQSVRKGYVIIMRTALVTFKVLIVGLRKEALLIELNR